MRSRSLVVMFGFVGALLAAGYGVLFTLLDDFRDTYGISESALGAVIGIGFLAGFVAQIALAPLADRGHARMLVLSGMVLNIVGVVLLAASSTVVPMLGGRFVMGLGAGMAVPAIRRIVILADPAHLGQNLGRILAADVAGFATGPAVAAIFSNLGLPSPANARGARPLCPRRSVTAARCRRSRRCSTACARVGLDDGEDGRILGRPARWPSATCRWRSPSAGTFGASTVSASVAIAAAAGISVFATGGIGGVHRGSELTGDISADLDALAHHPVVTVCAGAKAFLDLARTLEYLETVGVPVLGWRHDWFPAFYTRSSGLPVPHRVESAAEVADVLRAPRRGPTAGVLLAVPIPEDDELDPARIAAVLDQALADCDAAGITGAAITPFVLGRIAEATDGRSIPANLALAENNARVAAQVAVAIAEA